MRVHVPPTDAKGHVRKGASHFLCCETMLRLDAQQLVHNNSFSYLCSHHARHHRFQDRSHCCTKKLVNGTTRAMLRNRDLESALIIGSLGILRAVQRHQWLERGNKLSNFRDQLSLWSRNTWALLADPRGGPPILVGRQSNGATQVTAPKSIRELCTEWNVEVPFHFSGTFKPTRRRRLRI